MNTCYNDNINSICITDKGGNIIPFKNLYPELICPIAFYSVIPYVWTLSNNGWFRWVKRKKGLLRWNTYILKKTIGNIVTLNFKQLKENINIKYIGEVVVQCPNYQDGVVMGISFDKEKQETKIRIVKEKGKCPNNHKKEDIFTFKTLQFPLLEYNKIFPYINYLSISEKINTVNNLLNTNYLIDKFCGSDKNKIGIKIANLKMQCRYHDGNKLYYKKDELVPNNFCHHLFNICYPYFLALLYDAKFEKDSVIVECPFSEGKLSVEIERKERDSFWIRKVKQIIYKIFEQFFYPVDRPNVNIMAKVISKGVDCICKCDLQVGNIFYFNVKNKSEMCPAATHISFPYRILAENNMQIPWSKDFHCISCPDFDGPTYAIE